MVVTFGRVRGLLERLDPLADRCGVVKSMTVPLTGANSPSGMHVSIGRQIIVGGKGQHVVENRAMIGLPPASRFQ